ncbi:MAG: SWIM zinc finger family protein [Verrucomicrobiae bacterium]|nr:SWIM zinc finger family protein [Verrucomicrobiae bacterium]
MIEIDESYVDASAPNAAAIKNGRGLVLKGKLVALHKSADDTLLFGECSGSGKSNYQCSCDFVRPDQPTHRCSCPSRQFPCKHCLGLMYAFVQGKTFTVADVPDDLAGKREKLQERAVKKTASKNTPKKVNKSALSKKIKAQLDGLDLLEKLTHDLVRSGMGNMNAKVASQIETQAKQLGNAYLPGAQAALRRYTKLFSTREGRFDADLSATQRESVYSEALDQLTRLHALIKQGRAYLNARLEDPELKPETGTAIAAWLGHAWQLAELREAGRMQENVELAQLAFNTYDDVARAEFVDTGIWMNLATGDIQQTQTFRPYKAAKFIKSDDSFFQIAQVPELFAYPGDRNPRIRWEGMTPRPTKKKDFTAIRKHGSSDFASLIKEIKNQLKAPLADKCPVAALNFTRIGAIGKGDDALLVAEDANGERLVLTDTRQFDEPDCCHLLYLLPPKLLKNQTLIARFHHDLDSRTLRIKPLSIVTSDEIVRLTY